MYQIRQSDETAQAGKSHGSQFYYLLHIDDEGNQRVLFQSDNLAEVQNYEAIKGQNLQPVLEAETRGTFEPELESQESETAQ